MDKATFFILFFLMASSSLSFCQSITVQAQQLPVTGYSPFLSDKGDVLVFVDDHSKEFTSYDFKNRSQASLGQSSIGMLLYGFNADAVILQDRKSTFDFIGIDVRNGSKRKYTFGKNILVYPSQDLRSITIRKETYMDTINPVDGSDYINVSLSPDKRHILFRATGKGVYITDLVGNIRASFPTGQFPTWVNNSTILMAKVEDDGHQYLSSNLLFANILTKELTSIDLEENLIPLFPVSAIDGRIIVFNTPANHLYLVEMGQ